MTNKTHPEASTEAVRSEPSYEPIIQHSKTYQEWLKEKELWKPIFDELSKYKNSIASNQ